MAYYLNGQEIKEGQSFQAGGFEYPYSYLISLSQTKLASMGITQYRETTASLDPFYYKGNGDGRLLEDEEAVDPKTGDPLYVQVWDPEYDNGEGKEPGAMVDTEEKLINVGLKSRCITQVKETANTKLQPTDWYVYRKADRDIDIPEDVAAQRQAIIDECSRLETAIAAVESVEDLIDVMQSQDWGDRP